MFSLKGIESQHYSQAKPRRLYYNQKLQLCSQDVTDTFVWKKVFLMFDVKQYEQAVVSKYLKRISKWSMKQISFIFACYKRSQTSYFN